jgi:hypothetical protein
LTATLSEPEVLAELEDGFAVVRVPMGLLREQDKNARIMTPQMQASLAANIRRDGHLESLPLCHKLDGGEFEIISGHHRKRAAVQAEMGEIVVLAYMHQLAPSVVRAKQLAHNAHEGFDDPTTLRELYLEIDSPDDRLVTFIDPREIGVEAKATPAKIDNVIVPFDWHYVAFAFLPHQLERFEELCRRMAGDVDLLCTVPAEVFAAFSQTARRLGIAEDIRNVGTVIARMVQVTTEYLDGLEEAENDPQYPDAPAARG